mmetsp:Transcript_17309/g.29124  ORF Transcript_17309/g.29124 Transcript_17309/m.29124 type:complete len:110 (-) Transcript_17309:13-342(-)
MPKSILKSKALRPPPEKEDKQEVRVTMINSSGAEEEVKAEGDTKLTTEEITEGVKQAREAMNAPPTDLIEFEKALRKKHEEFKQAGVKPVIQLPKPKFKVPLQKRSQKK